MTIVSDFLAAIEPALVDFIATIAAVYLLPKLYDWLKISAESDLRDAVDNALNNGIHLAVDKLTTGKIDVTKLDALKADIIKLASEYALDNVPDALKKLKVDTNVAQLVEARLPTVLKWVVDSINATRA